MAKVIVTGCSKGLGRATAIALARRGHDVIATARRVETLADLPVTRRLALDVTDPGSVARARAEVGAVDVVVNNAAEIAIGPVESIPMAEAQRLYDVNVFGVLRVVQAFAPEMRARGAGTIVNVSSVAGQIAFPLNGVYSSTKWALEGLSEALRFELSRFGVRVLLIEPGAVNTGALDAPRTHLVDDDPYLPLAGQLRFDPARMSATEDVASAIADAVESPTTAFRTPVGPDAAALLDARTKLGDADFDRAFRQTLQLDW